MKHTCNYLFLLLLLLLPLLHACNGDVFVDEVKVPLTEATLGGDGDTLTLRFNTSEWQLNNVYNKEFTGVFAGTFYTLDGTDMGRTNCLLDGKGKIVVDYAPYEMTFIRPNDRELQILLGDNPKNEPFEFILMVGDKNYFQQEEIRITQQPGSGYVIDRIEYDPVPKDVHTRIDEDNYLIDCTDDPVTRTYNLSKRMRRWFNFHGDADLYLVPTGDEPPTIIVPAADISQGVKPGTDRIEYYRYGYNMLFVDMEPPVMRTLTLKPGFTSIMRLAEYQIYTAYYTLHLRNVKTGKFRTVQGSIQCTNPIEAITAYPKHHGNSDKVIG